MHMSSIRLVLFPLLRSLLLAALPACLGSLPDSPGEPRGPEPGQRPSPTPSSGDLLGSSGTGLGRPLGGVPGAALHSAHWEGEPAALSRSLLRATAAPLDPSAASEVEVEAADLSVVTNTEKKKHMTLFLFVHSDERRRDKLD